MKAILANALLYGVLLTAGAISGMSYESSRQAQAAKNELQELQRRAAGNAAWLRGERTASEAQLNEQILTLHTQLSQAQAQADENHHTLVSGLRNGAVSVRVPITPVPSSCTSDSARTAGHAAAAAQATHAQLDPEAAANLAAIPHEGDAAIRELNACITQYNQVKAEQDAWRLTLTQLETGHAQTP